MLKEKKINNILITGAGGFIGGNLSNFLSSRYNVFAFYNSKKRVKLKKKIKKFKQDLKNIKYINKKIDTIIHCASVVPPTNSQEKCFRVNISMDRALEKSILKSNIKKIIFLSSVSIYGKNRKNTIYESTKPLRPDRYGQSKLLGEKKFKNLSKKKKIKVIVLRLSTVIGKGCHSTFLSRLSEEIFKKNKIEIYNPNSKYNSCIHISNLNKIILKLLNLNQKKNFDVVNIHSSNPMKIIDIFKLFHRKTNNKKIKYFLKRSKKKSYLLKSKSLKSYKISVTSTKSNLQKFISEIY